LIAEEDPMSDRERELEAELEKAREETRDAFANRALMTAHIFDVLEEELGTDRATELLKRAVYRRGREIAERYRAAVEAGNLDEVGRIFVEGSASSGEIFEPSVEERDADGRRIVLRMNACVHKDTWREAGYAPERVDRLCDIASAVDFGTFEGAGLSLRFIDRQACPGSDRCLLELRLADKG
jgi:hypothetical protein